MTLPDGNAMTSKYATWNYTVKDIGEMFGVSAGKAYYMLRDSGCVFTKKHRKPVTEEERKRRSLSSKGRVFTQEHRKAISDSKKCCYNGLNGYGHTKDHCSGYILAYAPLHPHAHKDGYVMLHTVLMEREIGRYLESDEVVHPINRNRADNRIDNLQLMKKKDHMAFHMKQRHEEARGNGLSIK